MSTGGKKIEKGKKFSSDEAIEQENARSNRMQC
jgi:hypothetical protein